MANIIDTLHPKTSPSDNLYPNIKADNIPNGSITRTKLNSSLDALLNNIGQLHPTGADTSANILAKASDDGIWVGTDTGYWYYWDGAQYTAGGVYISNATTAVYHTSNQLEDNNGNSIYPLIVNSSISDNDISPNKLTYIMKYANLFNKATAVTDKWLDGTGNVVTNPNFPNYRVSDYISVEASSSYICNRKMFRICYYDDTKTFVSRTVVEASEVFTIPSGVSYCRFAYNDPSNDGTPTQILMFVKGSTIPVDYVPYGYYYTGDYYYIIDTQSTYYGKNVTSYGDSNVQNYRWQNYVTDEIHCLAITNCGVAGCRVSGSNSNAMWQDDRVNTIPSDTDLLLIMGGTNDSYADVTIGDITLDNVDTSTYVGAYNVMLGKIYDLCGDSVEIRLITPVPCFDSNYNLDKLSDIAEAVVKIGRLWSIPVIDMYSNIGLNSKNYSNYYSGDGIHINYNGGEKFANVIIKNL